MKFSDPYTLNLLWGLLPLMGIVWYGMHKRNKIMRAFMTHEILAAMAPGYSPARRWVKAVLIVASAGLAVTALAGPQAGFKWEKIEQRGVDIMIALDCSRSMLASDIKPSRLAQAKREIIDLLRMIRTDRAGLVAFSGTAILQCPLTLDREAFHIFLDVLEPGYLPVGGTDIAGALSACADGFERETDSQKAIILITDGEDTAGDGLEKAKELAGKGIKIFCVAVGNLDGAPIPDQNGGFKKDRSGNIILSKVDEKGLREIADITDGAYVRSVAGDMDLDLIYKDHILGKMEKSELTSGRKKVWENRFQWFLLPCVVLMLVELILPPSKRNKAKLNVVLLLGVFAWQIVLPGSVQAGMASSSVKEGIAAYEAGQYEKARKHFIDAQLEEPDNAAHYYNIGAAAYMNNEFEQARKNFVQAVQAQDETVRHNALYNLANTDYKLGRFDDAVKGYEKVLESYPDDAQAAQNLEFVKKKIEEQKQQPSQSQQNGQNEDKNRNQDTENQAEPSQGNQDDPPQNQESSQDGSKDNSGNDSSAETGGQPPQQPSGDQEGASPENQEQAEQGSSGNEGMDAKGADASDAEGAQAGKEEGSGMDQMLNRLEDKPGRAMMPVIRERRIEKDW